MKRARGSLWFDNDGAAGFTAHPMGESCSDYLSKIVVADIDGDDDVDCLQASWDPRFGNVPGSSRPCVTLYLNDGVGSFTEYGMASIPTLEDMVLRDVDGDSTLDLLVEGGLEWDAHLVLERLFDTQRTSWMRTLTPPT